MPRAVLTSFQRQRDREFPLDARSSQRRRSHSPSHHPSARAFSLSAPIIRYALPEFPRDEDGQLGLPGAPSVYFPRLPPKRVLTLNLEVPESWLVEATKSVYDLDNLRLVGLTDLDRA